MKLLLDIGNSRVKWAYSDGARLYDTGVVSHHTEDWLAVLPKQQVCSIWAANVAGSAIQDQLQDWARQCHQSQIRWVTSTAQACGVRNAYPRPERLGVDRWMACIAGYHYPHAGEISGRQRKTVLIADAGTALTLDFVRADGCHEGGLISPGVATMRQALRGGTRLRPEHIEVDLSWLANDTDPAVGLGTLHAVLALLENARRDLNPDCCLLTGGESELLVRHLPGHWQLAPQLVIEGIARTAFAESEDT